MKKLNFMTSRFGRGAIRTTKGFCFFVCEENYLVKYFMQTNQAYKAINGSIFVQGKFKQLFSVKETSGWMAGRVSSIFTTKSFAVAPYILSRVHFFKLF